MIKVRPFPFPYRKRARHSTVMSDIGCVCAVGELLSRLRCATRVRAQNMSKNVVSMEACTVGGTLYVGDGIVAGYDVVSSGGYGYEAKIGGTPRRLEIWVDGAKVHTIPEAREDTRVQLRAFGLDDKKELLILADCMKIVANATLVNAQTTVGEINVQGACDRASTTAGPIFVAGDVKGEVSTVSGSVKVSGDVIGDISTVSGSVVRGGGCKQHKKTDK